jgi:hypothetical protein
MASKAHDSNTYCPDCIGGGAVNCVDPDFFSSLFYFVQKQEMRMLSALYVSE